MPAANSIPLNSTQLDSASHVPLYVQLRDRLRGMIDDGRLRAGDRLSPTRHLAVELGVHRTTVEAAYAELESEGLLVGHVGRGTYVAGRPQPVPRASAPPETGAFFWSGYFSDNDLEDPHESLIRAASEPGTISFAAAHPPIGLVPLREFSRACDRALRRCGPRILRPGPTGGFPPLQEMIAARLAQQGISATAEEITITNGCQQSLDLLAKAFLAPGQSVVVENPVYPGAIAPFRQAGARTLALPMTADGPDMAALETILESHRVRLILVTPNFQNPTGALMTLDSRRRLLELARRFQVPVAENDSYGLLSFSSKTPRALKALDHSDGVIYLGSFFKCGFPGLRLGWCVASPAPTARLRRAKQSTDLHTDPFVQAVMLEFAEKGALDRTVAAVRAACKANAQTLAREVARRFPTEVTANWRAPQGGMSAWFRLPAGVTADAVLGRAREHRVIFTPGRFFYFQESQPETFRLSFGSVTRTEIARGVKVIGEAIRAEMKLAANRARHPARASGGWSLV